MGKDANSWNCSSFCESKVVSLGFKWQFNERRPRHTSLRLPPLWSRILEVTSVLKSALLTPRGIYIWLPSDPNNPHVPTIDNVWYRLSNLPSTFVGESHYSPCTSNFANLLRAKWKKIDDNPFSRRKILSVNRNPLDATFTLFAFLISLFDFDCCIVL